MNKSVLLTMPFLSLQRPATLFRNLELSLQGKVLLTTKYE